MVRLWRAGDEDTVKITVLIKYRDKDRPNGDHQAHPILLDYHTVVAGKIVKKTKEILTPGRISLDVNDSFYLVAKGQARSQGGTKTMSELSIEVGERNNNKTVQIVYDFSTHTLTHTWLDDA